MKRSFTVMYSIHCMTHLEYNSDRSLKIISVPVIVISYFSFGKEFNLLEGFFRHLLLTVIRYDVLLYINVIGLVYDALLL